MKDAASAITLSSVLFLVSLAAYASEALMVAQLPGQLPGQKPAGQLPSTVPATPARAAPPKASGALPLDPCCSITAINKATGVVTAREKGGSRIIEIKATPTQLQNLHVGQEIFANLETKKASLDGKTLSSDLIFVVTTPSRTATTLGAAPSGPSAGASGGGTTTGSGGSSSGSNSDGAPSCRSPQIACTSSPTVCADVKTDPHNCGTCGATCSGLSSFCSNGSCAASCAAGLNACRSSSSALVACVDSNTDNSNCGGCGVRCSLQESCQRGYCRQQ